MDSNNNSQSSKLDKTDVNGDGFIHYPSGRFAVMISSEGGCRVVTATADNDSGKVLLCFNHLGVGTVQYSNGKPWLVVSEEGWSVSDTSGKISERGRFPRRKAEPIICCVNKNLTVSFQDRQNIVATFTSEDLVNEIQCGEKLRRTEPYTSKILAQHHNGKLDLDVKSIRKRQKEVGLSGSLYVPPGPHHFKTEHPGVGGLKVTLRSLTPESKVVAMVSDLKALDNRLNSIDLMPKPLYGGLSASKGAITSTTFRSSAAENGAEDGTSTSGTNKQQILGVHDITSRNRGVIKVPENFGTPPLSNTMKTLSRMLRSPDPAKTAHVVLRRRLPTMPVADVFSKVLDEQIATRDTLIVLVLMADWSPACTKLSAQVQVTNRELIEEGAANPDGPAGHVQMSKVDASEGSLLQKQYGFKTVPMFLMMYEGKLVEATNNLHTSVEIKAAVMDALERARKKRFLPSNFSFVGRVDNTSLDYIKSSWSMLT
ncbi:hypothetical protein CEUSTIGMA_g5773.t1 [Chlamydomonas eustigma]|uniref:Thioredoxin domain-containing protein n=1 Tax=Chlamydomonas eustigma TaxID=1157962 RepID=A0A250X5H7_9CHLO|nr:hypothetical protein CEUSTIGMA_g5773.t1 [Chlamydomonas eustigma]|eukprot:GAX78331.1 hypothetical protein CEUSTIGMA_g5773.t1 [Chlamydomonas eustigma]